METIFDLITAMSDSPAISGKEGDFPFVFSDFETDTLGNVWAVKKSQNPQAKTILFEAHRDEVGLCVKEILNGGFIKVAPCGGLSVDVLPGCRFEILGKERVYAVAASVPPHLSKMRGEHKNDKADINDLFLDTGFSDSKELKKRIGIGDSIIFSQKPAKMLGGRITGRSLDNKAGVTSLMLAAHRLNDPKNNIIFLFSVGEETSSRGVRQVCRRFRPDAAIVVDAGFAFSEGMDPTKCIVMGKGPSVSFTDTLSLSMSRWLVSLSKRCTLPLQTIAEPGGTGTSATAIQVECGGIPSAVISIPVANMHTPCEIVSTEDIDATARLLCAIANETDLPPKEVNIQ